MSVISPSIVADSSFYLCFLEDIHNPDPMVALLAKFPFVVSPAVSYEVTKCQGFKEHGDKMTVSSMSVSTALAEVLKPFFSKAQIHEGETETISLAFLLHSEGNLLYLVLDEEKARNFVVRNFEALSKFLTGTLGLIGYAYCNHSIFDREYSLALIETIGKSEFRTSANTLSTVISRIKTCK